jgi:hypothetical protein
MSHSHDPENGPCPHMRVLLSDLASGNLRGVMKWFTEQHAAGCPRCHPALESLRDLRGRLLNLGKPNPKDEELVLTPEQRAEVEAAWDAEEGRRQ